MYNLNSNNNLQGKLQSWNCSLEPFRLLGLHVYKTVSLNSTSVTYSESHEVIANLARARGQVGINLY